MATIKNLLLDLKDEKNIDIIQIIKSFIYDDKQLRVYSEGRRYKYRDIVIRFDTVSNRFMTYRCKVDNSSDKWNTSEWQKETALNTLLAVEDKLIKVSTTQPTDIENKLWYKETKAFSNGSKNVDVMVKNDKKTYDKIYPKSISENIFMDNNESLSLKNKLNKDDIDLNRIRSNYIIDVFNTLGNVEVLLDNGTSMYVDTIEPSKCTITGNHTKNKSIIII